MELSSAVPSDSVPVPTTAMILVTMSYPSPHSSGLLEGSHKRSQSHALLHSENHICLRLVSWHRLPRDWGRQSSY